MQIGELAKRAAVPIETVRYYERRGLMAMPNRRPSGYRAYETSDLERLRFIRRGKSLGFSLDEIHELLRLTASSDSDRGEVRALAQQRLADVERRLCELHAVRDVLADLVQACSGQGSVEGCPIIQRVLAEDDPGTPP